MTLVIMRCILITMMTIHVVVTGLVQIVHIESHPRALRPQCELFPSRADRAAATRRGGRAAARYSAR